MAATNPIRPDEAGEDKHRLVVHIPISLRDALQRAAVERSVGKPRITTVSRLVRDLLQQEFGDDDGRPMRVYGRTRRRSTGCSPQPVPASNPATEQDTPLPEAIGF